MELDKIFLALSESYRKAIASIILCTLMLYPILYFSINDFKFNNWYIQLLLSAGIATTYITAYAVWTIAAIKSSDVFLFPVGLIATCGLGEIVRWIYNGNCDIGKFTSRLIIFSAASFVLIYALAYKHKVWGRKERPEKAT